jgi:hypothetical protein
VTLPLVYERGPTYVPVQLYMYGALLPVQLGNRGGPIPSHFCVRYLSAC